MFDKKIDGDTIRLGTVGPMFAGRKQFKVTPPEGIFNRTSPCRLFAFFRSADSGQVESKFIDCLTQTKMNKDRWRSEKQVFQVLGTRTEVRFMIENDNKCFVSNRKYLVRPTWASLNDKDYTECLDVDNPTRTLQAMFFKEQLNGDLKQNEEPNPSSASNSQPQTELVSNLIAEGPSFDESPDISFFKCNEELQSPVASPSFSTDGEMPAMTQSSCCLFHPYPMLTPCLSLNPNHYNNPVQPFNPNQELILCVLDLEQRLQMLKTMLFSMFFIPNP
ncbi:hypothetical protein C9374_007421 [Naegleria lovaniensis]|uniref:Uncharacterized protein n=1 Tax=Naegleria lovaniensis TaxID=51637 RepID=A0AA88GH07_NAELO|nr:uncharacterized protein C9374_007421 [Naegleria lovaniensis]KAG2379282.1 hypothetical protein C9374_007421 [Naegleria lovaniensis]